MKEINKFNPYYHRLVYRSKKDGVEYLVRVLKERYEIDPHLKHPNGKKVRDTKQVAIRASLSTFLIKKVGLSLHQAGEFSGLHYSTAIYHREKHSENMRLTHNFGEYYRPCYELCEQIYSHITKHNDENRYEKMALIGLDPTVGYIKRVTQAT